MKYNWKKILFFFLSHRNISPLPFSAPGPTCVRTHTQIYIFCSWNINNLSAEAWKNTVHWLFKSCLKKRCKPWTSQRAGVTRAVQQRRSFSRGPCVTTLRDAQADGFGCAPGCSHRRRRWEGLRCRDLGTGDSLRAKRGLAPKTGNGVFIGGGLEMGGRLKIVKSWKKGSRSKTYRKRHKLQHSKCWAVVWERGGEMKSSLEGM